MIKGITIVKSTANNSSYNSFGDSKRHLPASTTEVMNTIKPATTSLRNMLSNVLLFSKVTPNFLAKIADVKFWLS